MKKLIICLTLFASTISLQAQKYFTKTGFTEFKASVEAFEPVEAKNNSTTAVLNSETGEIAALLFIKAFKFEVALMEEHFNENYMDSDKHPKATFKGKLVDFDVAKLSADPKDYKVTGKLIVRGEEKQLDTQMALSLVNGKIVVKGGFNVKPEEFKIEIPSVVSSKIAESININLDYELVKK